MGSQRKTLLAVLSGQSDHGIRYRALCNLLIWLGFSERQKGGHRIFFKLGIEEIVNLQPEGSNAKGYQVKQIRDIVFRYKMHIGRVK